MVARRTASRNRAALTSLRLGLCCQFASEPIKFRTTTATALLRLGRKQRLARLAALCRENAEALRAALEFCAAHGIGAFRINSQILPAKTHPAAGYRVGDLPDGADIIARFRACGDLARARGIRLSFHPDQFVVLNSPNPRTLEQSVAELVYQAEVAEWVGADTINIHGGGAYGDKVTALRALRDNIRRLPRAVSSRLTLENDDKVYTPSDLLPVCAAAGVPMVYDVHHHRCLPDGLTVAEATERAGHMEIRTALPPFQPPRGLVGAEAGAASRLHQRGGFSGGVAGLAVDGRGGSEGQGAGRAPPAGRVGARLSRGADGVRIGFPTRGET